MKTMKDVVAVLKDLWWRNENELPKYFILFRINDRTRSIYLLLKSYIDFIEIFVLL